MARTGEVCARMYGMIHQALRDMALREMGAASWNGMLREAGLTQTLFIGMEYYPDEVTMSLVRLLARRLDMPTDDFLREFGRTWIDFAGASAYGRILDMAGHDLVSFVEGLDRMHSSIRSNMPKADMPAFEVIDACESAIVLRYRSSRTGLAPFVQGILSAVAERFDERRVITYQPEGDGVRFTLTRVAADA